MMLVYSGTLYVPEYNITEEDALIARLNLEEDESTTFTILCEDCSGFTPPDYGLVTIDKDTKEIR